jgi:hypothetical protein
MDLLVLIIFAVKTAPNNMEDQPISEKELLKKEIRECVDKIEELNGEMSVLLGVADEMDQDSPEAREKLEKFNMLKTELKNLEGKQMQAFENLGKLLSQ